MTSIANFFKILFLVLSQYNTNIILKKWAGYSDKRTMMIPIKMNNVLLTFGAGYCSHQQAEKPDGSSGRPHVACLRGIETETLVSGKTNPQKMSF